MIWYPPAAENFRKFSKRCLEVARTSPILPDVPKISEGDLRVFGFLTNTSSTTNTKYLSAFQYSTFGQIKIKAFILNKLCCLCIFIFYMNETILLDCGHVPLFFVADEKMSPFHSNLAFIRQAWRKNRYENQDVRTFIQIFSLFSDTWSFLVLIVDFTFL